MRREQDYIRDIAEMRTMMERSSKFLSLSGLSGIMAGIYALAGAFIAYRYGLYPDGQGFGTEDPLHEGGISKMISLAAVILLLTLVTALLLSGQKAGKKGEKLWNAASRRLLINMAVPLISGGLLILIMISNGLIGFVAPFSLVFYGLALYNASKFTYEEMRSLGLIEIILGLISSYFVSYGLLFWAIGFGILHIIYGVYMHYRYER